MDGSQWGMSKKDQEKAHTHTHTHTHLHLHIPALTCMCRNLMRKSSSVLSPYKGNSKVSCPALLVYEPQR